jgi:hypothetical protein
MTREHHCARLPKLSEYCLKQKHINFHLPNKTSTLVLASMEIDEDLIITRLQNQGFTKLDIHEKRWVIEMTKTRHPYWDPLIQDAYLNTGTS